MNITHVKRPGRPSKSSYAGPVLALTEISDDATQPPKPTPALTIDLFDLDNIDDLPPKMQTDFARMLASQIQTKILKLFDIKDTLSLPEIVAAMYRLYNFDKSHHWYKLNLKSLIDSLKIVKIQKNPIALYQRFDLE